MASNNGVSQVVRRSIMRRDRFTCQICGIVGREYRFRRGGFGYETDLPDVFLSIDHVIPRSRGGSSDPSNLRVLCTLCNTLKGSKTDAEWRAEGCGGAL